MTLIQFPRAELPSPELPLGQDNVVLDREADHRISNNLGLVVSLLRQRARAVGRQSGTMERADVSMLLDDIAARVDSVARLHRMLSHSLPNAMLDLADYLRQLCDSLTKSLSPGERVQVSYRTDDICMLAPDQVLTVGLLVSELITNSVKYAHPAGLPVRIQVMCSQTEGCLTVEIADDGVGLPEGFDLMADGGLGLRVVRSLTAQLGATIRFTSNPLGTLVCLQVPAPALPPRK